jgi:hypothetical protein
LVVGLVAVFEGDEGVDGLASELVIDADDGGFGDGIYQPVSIRILLVFMCDLRCSIKAASISAVDRR